MDIPKVLLRMSKLTCKRCLFSGDSLNLGTIIQYNEFILISSCSHFLFLWVIQFLVQILYYHEFWCKVMINWHWKTTILFLSKCNILHELLSSKYKKIITISFQNQITFQIIFLIKVFRYQYKLYCRLHTYYITLVRLNINDQYSQIKWLKVKYVVLL